MVARATEYSVSVVWQVKMSRSIASPVPEHIAEPDLNAFWTDFEHASTYNHARNLVEEKYRSHKKDEPKKFVDWIWRCSLHMSARSSRSVAKSTAMPETEKQPETGTANTIDDKRQEIQSAITTLQGNVGEIRCAIGDMQAQTKEVNRMSRDFDHWYSIHNHYIAHERHEVDDESNQTGQNVKRRHAIGWSTSDDITWDELIMSNDTDTLAHWWERRSSTKKTFLSLFVLLLCVKLRSKVMWNIRC